MRLFVVTATLGERDTLSRTIESVRTIGGSSVTHLVVAPEDKVQRIKTIYGSSVECVAEPKNSKGFYGALNHCFYTYGCGYDYFTFINDDDYWLPDFAKLIRLVEEHPDLDMVYAKTLYVDENNNVIKRQACSNQFYRFNDLFHENVILLTQQTTLVKKDFFFKVGGFDDSYKLIADTKFWIQASLMKPKFRYIKSFVSCYTLQESQLSKDKAFQEKEHERLRDEYPSCSVFRRRLFLIAYRIYNLNVYFKRLFINK